MRTNNWVPVWVVVGVWSGCSGGGNGDSLDATGTLTTGLSSTADGDPATSAGDPTSVGSRTGSGSTGSGSTASDSAASGTTGTGSSDSGSVFLIQPDFGDGASCSFWDQNCPAGQKCMPWANDGGNTWNDTKCTPLSPDPAGPGDPCVAEGSGVSGIDNCELASMCWNVDPETNEGTCVAFCTGSESAPACNNPSEHCNITSEGVLPLCFPMCDPLLQDCAAGLACYRVFDTFTCAPDASGADEGAYPDPCSFINACDPGLECSNPQTVPGCVAESCCSPYCDLSATENTCPGAADGQECVPAFPEGAVPPGYENVGNCAVPS